MAWAKFEAFRTHLPNSLDEEAVAQFHAIVSLLEEASGEDLAGFRIPENEIKHRVISISLCFAKTLSSEGSLCGNNVTLVLQQEMTRAIFWRKHRWRSKSSLASGTKL
jgi:hypothetical protein